MTSKGGERHFGDDFGDSNDDPFDADESLNIHAGIEGSKRIHQAWRL